MRQRLGSDISNPLAAATRRVRPSIRHPRSIDRSGTAAFWIGATLVCLGLIAGLYPQKRTYSPPSLVQTQPIRTIPHFPPHPVGLAPPSIKPGRMITALAMRPPQPQDPFSEAFERSEDLHELVFDLLPDAMAGDGAAQYYLYLALEECRAYLGPNAHATLHDTTLKPYWRNIEGSVAQVSNAEREQWLTEFQRCKNFVGANLLSLELALGDELPGAVNEYGSIWFERAFHSGYPLALLDMTQRLTDLRAQARNELLYEALLSEDPRIYLGLFEHFWDSTSAASHRLTGMAWLLVTCRAGLDCGQDAYWYRTRYCLDSPSVTCHPADSALLHFWASLSPEAQQKAFDLSLQIEAALESGQLDQLPLLPE